MEIKLSNISSKIASENKKTIDKNLLCYTLPPAQTEKAVSARSIPHSPTASARPARGSARWAESATTCLHSPLSRPMAQLASLEPVRPPAAVGWDRTATRRFRRGKNRRPVHPPQNPSALFSIPQLSRLPSRVRRRPSPARRDRPAPSPWSRARARRLPFSELHGCGRPWRPATLAVGASEGRHRWIQSSHPRAVLSFPSLF